MPLAGHDIPLARWVILVLRISTPMPLAGHDLSLSCNQPPTHISTPMPLAGHDKINAVLKQWYDDFYSHAPRGA